MGAANAWRRRWPDSLFGQLCVIVVVGGLSAQLLFGSLWYDVRYSQVLEEPARLVIFRTAAVVNRLADGKAIDDLATEVFHPQLRAAPLPSPPRQDDARANVARLMQDALRRETGEALPLSLLDVDIRNDRGDASTWAGLTGLSPVVGHFDFQLRLAPRRWLRIRADQAQGWNARPAWIVLGDYALRVYLLRALALIAVALVVVRVSTRPLRRLIRAASALGRDIERPPLPVEGPREMRQAAEAFNAMQQRLIDLIRERTELLAAVSHDLRTPLTRMRLRVEGIGEDALREKLVGNIVQMETLIAALLDSVGDGAGPEESSAFDLAGLVREVVDDFVETGSDIRWDGAAEAFVSGQAASIRRVLHNLIENALRYAGSTRLTLRLAGRWVELTIEDDGPGIEVQRLADIMQPRVRGDAEAGGALGYGLGLSIARSIVMAHRGRLRLENRTGGGLRVVMALPAMA